MAEDEGTQDEGLNRLLGLLEEKLGSLEFTTEILQSVVKGKGLQRADYEGMLSSYRSAVEVLSIVEAIKEIDPENKSGVYDRKKFLKLEKNIDFFREFFIGRMEEREY